MRDVQIAHDPFGRFTTYRRVVPRDERQPCRWCGQEGRYYYATQSDDRAGRRLFYHERPYCSVGCFRTFWDV
jgi:hypothetical protein